MPDNSAEACTSGLDPHVGAHAFYMCKCCGAPLQRQRRGRRCAHPSQRSCPPGVPQRHRALPQPPAPISPPRRCVPAVHDSTRHRTIVVWCLFGLFEGQSCKAACSAAGDSAGRWRFPLQQHHRDGSTGHLELRLLLLQPLLSGGQLRLRRGDAPLLLRDRRPALVRGLRRPLRRLLCGLCCLRSDSAQIVRSERAARHGETCKMQCLAQRVRVESCDASLKARATFGQCPDLPSHLQPASCFCQGVGSLNFVRSERLLPPLQVCPCCCHLLQQ